MARQTRDSRSGGVAALLVGLLMAASAGGLAAVDSDQQPEPDGFAASSSGDGESLLTPLVIAEPSHQATYVRIEFGSRWIDADKNCRNTRAEVLVAQSEDEVEFRPPRECAVQAGLWIDPWSGQTITEASKLDVDHTVPLANAWRSGAWEWTREQRVEYANYLDDPEHLIAIRLSDNRRKGDKGPEAWQPVDEDSWCEYAIAWSRIKGEWDLTATEHEWDALEEMAATC
jgi:hypothetical protein